jgi:alginate O-acetyltransferase complex protein AlgI
MVFSSSLFIFIFLPLFLILYNSSFGRLKNITILLFSIFFYAWGAPSFIFIVLCSLVLNYYIVNLIDKNIPRRNIFLWLSIAINVGLLAYFKYANFFIENLNQLLLSLGFEYIEWVRITLPIGISFFTFQSLTYTIDVYRGVHKPLNKIGDYLLYILMFPQLIAGPIVRFHTIADQIENRRDNENSENRVLGFYRFVIGLSKKVLLANTLGLEVDSIFNDLTTLNSIDAWIGILAYTFQIYFDFSGYSDMAIGLGRMIGFTFPENFNNPYISQNITEFWRRWHITLSAWMKDYLYIPLGGNRVDSNIRLYFNLSVVFIISGLWHGASWNFVIWGAYHGLFLILDRIFFIRILNHTYKIIRVFLTFLIVMIGWIFFRIENFSDALLVLRKMFVFETMGMRDYSTEFIIILILSIIFSFITLTKTGQTLETYVYFKNNKHYFNVYMLIPIIILFVLSVAYITGFGFNPFIYFRF